MDLMYVEKIRTLAKTCSTVPVYREVYSDTTTPVMILRKLEGLGSRCFLLESVEDGKNWGRYSFLGYDPVMRVYCKDQTVYIEADGEVIEKPAQKPFDVLREIMAEYHPPEPEEDMPPFTGGFVGYFAYSVFRYKEPNLKLSPGEFNDFDLMLFDRIIAFDHLKQKIFIIAHIKSNGFDKEFERVSKQFDFIENLIHRPVLMGKPSCRETPVFSCNLEKDQYCGLVDRTKEYIREGDIFQAVLSRKFSASIHGSLINAYRVLRTTNTSPYMVYLKIDDMELMCSSPETLIRLRNGRLTTFPIAGSRPRGITPEEDRMLEQELLSDEKELSEHNMLVDLGRNDLGMISEYGSVKVTNYMAIHRYSRIMHICSEVQGDLLPGLDAFHAIEAVLPAGTLSGAPKIRACEIIEEMEEESRGIYGGALGYIDFSGNMDTCIAIRMAVKRGDTVTVQAGGGIVADSVPEKEYDESGNKAKAVINAIIRAKEVEDI